MALTFNQKCKAHIGGMAFRAYEVTSDGSTTTIDASDLDMYDIGVIFFQPKEDLSFATNLDFANLADAAGVTTQIAATGAVLGDFVQVTGSVDCLDMIVTGYVQADDAVDVRVQNESGNSDLNLAEVPFHARVIKRMGLESLTTSKGGAEGYAVFYPTLTSGDIFTVWALGF